MSRIRKLSLKDQILDAQEPGRLDMAAFTRNISLANQVLAMQESDRLMLARIIIDSFDDSVVGSPESA